MKLIGRGGRGGGGGGRGEARFTAAAKGDRREIKTTRWLRGYSKLFLKRGVSSAGLSVGAKSDSTRRASPRDLSRVSYAQLKPRSKRGENIEESRAARDWGLRERRVIPDSRYSKCRCEKRREDSRSILEMSRSSDAASAPPAKISPGYCSCLLVCKRIDAA